MVFGLLAITCSLMALYTELAGDTFYSVLFMACSIFCLFMWWIEAGDTSGINTPFPKHLPNKCDTCGKINDFRTNHCAVCSIQGRI